MKLARNIIFDIGTKTFIVENIKTLQIDLENLFLELIQAIELAKKNGKSRIILKLSVPGTLSIIFNFKEGKFKVMFVLNLKQKEEETETEDNEQKGETEAKKQKKVFLVDISTIEVLLNEIRKKVKKLAVGNIIIEKTEDRGWCINGTPLADKDIKAIKDSLILKEESSVGKQLKITPEYIYLKNKNVRFKRYDDILLLLLQ